MLWEQVDIEAMKVGDKYTTALHNQYSNSRKRRKQQIINKKILCAVNVC